MFKILKPQNLENFGSRKSIKDFLGDKKAGEKWLSIWWFFVLIVIVSGIVIGVLMNVQDTSIKAVEADVLVNRVIDCAVKNGYVVSDVLDKKFDLLKECYLSKEVIESGKYYLNLEAYDFDKCQVKDNKLECKDNMLGNEYVFGISAFETECKLKGQYMPKCSEKYVYVLNQDGKNQKRMILRVIAGSNQEARREV